MFKNVIKFLQNGIHPYPESMKDEFELAIKVLSGVGYIYKMPEDKKGDGKVRTVFYEDL